MSFLRLQHAENRMCLKKYDWPGNIRELRNVVKLCSLTATGAIIEARDIPAQYAMKNLRTRSTRLADNEVETIRKALQDAGGNKQQAANLLGISRRTLYNKLDRYGIS